MQRNLFPLPVRVVEFDISLIKYARLVLAPFSTEESCKQVLLPLHLYTQRVSLPLRCVAEKMRKRWCNFTDTQLSLPLPFIMSPAHFGAKKSLEEMHVCVLVRKDSRGGNGSFISTRRLSMRKRQVSGTRGEKKRKILKAYTKTPSSAETHFYSFLPHTSWRGRGYAAGRIKRDAEGNALQLTQIYGG